MHSLFVTLLYVHGCLTTECAALQGYLRSTSVDYLLDLTFRCEREGEKEREYLEV